MANEEKKVELLIENFTELTEKQEAKLTALQSRLHYAVSNRGYTDLNVIFEENIVSCKSLNNTIKSFRSMEKKLNLILLKEI
ncbi:hypothetical protein [Bacillus thuringiensis]|uniref:hypothetical protein n=1 Tax=Bacillus thuringiensis TaxID=1428 RepID=UPI000BFB3F17|nr:hypothetical protein [Bacillus thuringiensis]PGT89845.1 hypothetical protein COD17_08840 [Bacillus thuringiensis]